MPPSYPTESHFNIMRRMADYHYRRATTWSELRAAHDQFFADYNLQAHYAHRTRKHGRQSPSAVLGLIHGVWCDEAELDRLFRIRSERVFDRGGYLRYKRWPGALWADMASGVWQGNAEQSGCSARY